MSDKGRTPRTRGLLAARRGDDATDNPFQAGTAAWDQWLLGFMACSPGDRDGGRTPEDVAASRAGPLRWQDYNAHDDAPRYGL